MRQSLRWLPVCANGLPGPASGGEPHEHGGLASLGGYVVEQGAATTPQDRVSVWGCVLVMSGPVGESRTAADVPVRRACNSLRPEGFELRRVGRLVPVGVARAEPEVLATVRTLRPLRSGQAYRIASPPPRGVVTPELAEMLEAVFERVGREHGFTTDKPLDIHLSRGFKAGSPGHGEGRAVDIAAVGGKRMLEWRQEWERAIAAVDKMPEPPQRAEAIAAEQKRNLGYALYKALQEQGGWRVDPSGWRPYRGVVQLFGPWTPTEGPWKTMLIKDPNPYQRHRLADQQWVFQAHQDHIHVTR